jgi:cytidylate kinase
MEGEKNLNNYVITIARGFGSGGKDIGNRLGKRLGIECYENRILMMASEYSGINERLFYEIDEKVRGSIIKKKFRAGLDFSAVPHPEDKDFVSDKSLYQIQAQIIRDLAERESCIIVGKCANKILEGRDNVISLYIEAPRANCLDSIMEKMQISEKEAARLITKTDKYRAEYYKYYTGGDYWTNPTSYDLTINTGRMSRDQAVDLIIDYMKIKFGI